jgi:hypothetical protein
VNSFPASAQAGNPIICLSELPNRNFLIGIQVEAIAIAIARRPSGGQENVMAKFYINFRYDKTIDHDNVGIDLPSLNEAREATLLSLRELWPKT